jgi:hypothetical protein
MVREVLSYFLARFAPSPPPAPAPAADEPAVAARLTTEAEAMLAPAESLAVELEGPLEGSIEARSARL